MGTYELRMYDEPLMTFEGRDNGLAGQSVHFLSVNEARARVLPYRLVPADRTDNDLWDWLSTRVVPRNRRFVDQIFEQAGIVDRSTLGIIDVCLGLSVNDAFWVVPEGFGGTWAEYNLYHNELDDALALAAYTGYTSTQKKRLGLSSEWTTDGQFPKAWRRLDGGLCLYKAGTEGYANSGVEPYSEYMAAQVADVLGLPHVPYHLDTWHGRLASVCPLMNDEDVSFVPFWSVAHVGTFPGTLAAALAMGSDAFEGLRDMLVFDAVICNTDRHANNFGFMRDNATGDLLSLAPAFDHNLSLFPQDMAQDFPSWQTAAGRRFPAGARVTFDEVARGLMAPRHHAALRRLVDIDLRNDPNHPLPTERLAALDAFLHSQARRYLSFAPRSTAEVIDEIGASEVATPSTAEILDGLDRADARQAHDAGEAVNQRKR